MSLTAQTLENSAKAAAYPALQGRDLLLCLVGLYASTNSLTAQQAATAAAANHYGALSDRQLDEVLLVILS